MWTSTISCSNFIGQSTANTKLNNTLHRPIITEGWKTTSTIKSWLVDTREICLPPVYNLHLSSPCSSSSFLYGSGRSKRLCLARKLGTPSRMNVLRNCKSISRLASNSHLPDRPLPLWSAGRRFRRCADSAFVDRAPRPPGTAGTRYRCWSNE